MSYQSFIIILNQIKWLFIKIFCYLSYINKEIYEFKNLNYFNLIVIILNIKINQYTIFLSLLNLVNKIIYINL
jgi:hypothetical protein